MTTHGEYASYKVGGCREECCRSAVRAYDQHRRRQIAYGRWQPWGDDDKVREHMTYLVSNHWTLAAVAKKAGVSYDVLANLRRNPKARVRADVADRILSVQPRDRVGYIPAAGTMRRLRALSVQGHGLQVVADVSGVSTTALSLLRAGRREFAKAGIARRVAVAYEVLRAREAATDASVAVRNRALAAGWHGHAAWSRFTIDDPGANPMKKTTAA